MRKTLKINLLWKHEDAFISYQTFSSFKLFSFNLSKERIPERIVHYFPKYFKNFKPKIWWKPILKIFKICSLIGIVSSNLSLTVLLMLGVIQIFSIVCCLSSWLSWLTDAHWLPGITGWRAARWWSLWPGAEMRRGGGGGAAGTPPESVSTGPPLLLLLLLLLSLLLL